MLDLRNVLAGKAFAFQLFMFFYLHEGYNTKRLVLYLHGICSSMELPNFLKSNLVFLKHILLSFSPCKKNFTV